MKSFPDLFTRMVDLTSERRPFGFAPLESLDLAQLKKLLNLLFYLVQSSKDEKRLRPTIQNFDSKKGEHAIAGQPEKSCPNS